MKQPIEIRVVYSYNDKVYIARFGKNKYVRYTENKDLAIKDRDGKTIRVFAKNVWKEVEFFYE